MLEYKCIGSVFSRILHNTSLPWYSFIADASLLVWHLKPKIWEAHADDVTNLNLEYPPEIGWTSLLQ